MADPKNDKDDGSWWGSSSKSTDDGGEHHTLHTPDGGRYSYDTDKDGRYIPNSGHGGGINKGEYRDKDDPRNI